MYDYFEEHLPLVLSASFQECNDINIHTRGHYRGPPVEHDQQYQAAIVLISILNH